MFYLCLWNPPPPALPVVVRLLSIFCPLPPFVHMFSRATYKLYIFYASRQYVFLHVFKSASLFVYGL